MTSKLFSTFPSNKDAFWQIVLIPTVSILRCSEDDRYTVVNIEWLFWNISTIINDKGAI